MNQLGFLHLILLYAWPTSIFLKKTWVSHIAVKFFRSETAQNIPQEHSAVRSVKLLTKHWLTQSTPLRSPRRMQAQMNKGSCILGSWSKCQLVCLKQETTMTMYIAGWMGKFHFFYQHSLPSTTPLWNAILCSFCYQHHWRLHPKGRKWIC